MPWYTPTTAEEAMKVRAYYKHAHREMEGLPPNPDCDWLDAEWEASNRQDFRMLDEAVVKALTDCSVIMGRCNLRFDTPLPGSTASIISCLTMSFLRHGYPYIKLPADVAQSRSYASLVDRLVTGVRLYRESLCK